MGVEDTTPIYRPFRAYVIYVEGRGVCSRNGGYTYDPLDAAIFYESERDLLMGLAAISASENPNSVVQLIEAPDMFLVYITAYGKFVKDLYKFTLTSKPAYAQRFLGENIAEVRNMLDNIRVDYRILHIC